ncbi:MAG: FtsX-like permease family protein [Saprospiraceae bacterium]|nr:ABC transporter permease [Lewinella sp.]
MILKLAWRNIWRNRRRTLITMASILFAVLFASFMESLQKGAWNHMIKNVVNYYFGYAQIHQKGYWDEQTIDKAFTYSDTLSHLDSKVSAIQGVVPRLESFALASTGNQTTGVLVIGIDPERENAMTNLHNRITQGTYLEDNDKAVLIADGIAEHLQLKLGDTLVLISQGYHGINAAGKYPIKGFVHFGSPDLNKQMVYLPLKESQWFFGADGLITSLALKIDDPDEIRSAVHAVKSILPANEYEVMDWKELLPDLLQAKALDSAGNYIVYFILYMIIAFGILGTILMMTKEREYEFGVLVSIGMRRMKLGFTVWIEILIMGLLGALTGILASMPVIWYFHQNPIRFTGEYAKSLEQFGFEPIFPAEFNLAIFSMQAIIVFLITSLLALYPFLKLKKLQPVEAMRD